MPNLNKLINLLQKQHMSRGQVLIKLSVSESILDDMLEELSVYGVEVIQTDGKLSLLQQYDFHDQELIKAGLESNNVFFDYIQVLPITTSTNDLIKNNCDTYQTALIIAECQTDGRGRRGSIWVSPFASNIYCSIKWPINNRQHLGLLSLGLGVAVANSLAPFVDSKVAVKWPNDIWIDDKKVAGIIVELDTNSSIWSLTIGIGINVYMQQTQGKLIDQAWTSLQQHNFSVNKDELAISLVNNVVSTIMMFEKNQFESIINAWSEMDMLSNRLITITTGNKTLKGVVEGIDYDGALLLKQHNGEIVRAVSGHIEEIQ